MEQLHIREKVTMGLEALRPEMQWLAVAAAGFLCGRATLLDGLKPFGAPLVALCGAAGLPALPAALGACLGILSTGFNVLNATVLVPPLLVFFAVLALGRAGRELSFGWGALLVVAARLVALPLRPILLYYALQFAIETGLAVTAFYALYVTVSAYQEGRKLADAGPLVCVAISAGVLMVGLPNTAFFSLRHFAAMLITLAAATAGGAAAGAAGGLALGLVLALSNGVDAALGAALGVSGLLAGVFRPLKRFGLVGGFALGAVLMSAWTTKFTAPVLPWKEALLAGGLFLALPRAGWELLESRLAGGAAEDEEGHELRLGRMRELVVNKIADFSKCLDELSTVFGEKPGGGDTWEDMAPLMEAVATEACHGCPLRERCWQTDFYATYGHFMAALSAPGRGTLLESDFPEEFRNYCRNFPDVVASLRSVWGLFRVKSGYRRRIDESRELAGRQLKGIAQVMEQLAGQMNAQIRLHEDAAQLVREALKGAGVLCKSVSVQENRANGLTVSLTAPSCGGRRRCRAYEEILSQALGSPMRRVGTACNAAGAACHLEFQQVQAMRVACAGAQRAREGAVCGDSTAWDSLDDSSYFLAISDGMGSGPKAAMESQATLSLLQRFYQAGFSEDVIYDTINQVMLLRSSGETFSTVDLCLLNLVDGEANFIKIGAPPTFILRRGQVQLIASPTLPLGILDEVAPGTARRVLEDGDLIVLASDGVTGADDTEWLEEELLQCAEMEPHQVAERLLDAALQRFGHTDDMTVVAARVRLPRRTGVETSRRKLHRWKARIVAGN